MAMVGFVILFVVVAILSGKQRKSRQQALDDLARSMGWAFDPSMDHGHVHEHHGFALFSMGDDRAAYNTLRCTMNVHGRDCPVTMGDYTYTTTSNSGKSRSETTHHISYLILHLPYTGVPSLWIRPENVLDKIAGAIGFDDIDFESEAFSRAMHVSGNDKRFAYDLITPAMMEFLLATRGPVIEIRGNRACLSSPGPEWTPDQFLAKLAWCQRFIRLWPEHLTATLASLTRAQRGG